MPQIRAHQGVVTQVNVFTVAPENQQRLIDLLIEAANSVRDVPGWMSASIHRSIDGTRVVNYAQCESMTSWEAVMAKLQEGGFLQRNKNSPPPRRAFTTWCILFARTNRVDFIKLIAPAINNGRD